MKAKNNSQAESLSDIPKTGRIGRFAKILEKEVNEDVLIKIMHGFAEYNSLKSDSKASWWKNTIENMETELGKKKSITIMSACGEKCCGKGQRKTAKRLMNESKSIEEFSIKSVNMK